MVLAPIQVTDAGFTPMTDTYVWAITLHYAYTNQAASLVSILVSRFILNLREEFGTDRRNTEHAFDLSDMATVRYVEQSEERPNKHEETDDLHELQVVHVYSWFTPVPKYQYRRVCTMSFLLTYANHCLVLLVPCVLI